MAKIPIMRSDGYYFESIAEAHRSIGDRLPNKLYDAIISGSSYKGYTWRKATQWDRPDMLKVVIYTNTPAFRKSHGKSKLSRDIELSKILKSIGEAFSSGIHPKTKGVIQDTDGKQVGQWKIERDL